MYKEYLLKKFSPDYSLENLCCCTAENGLLDCSVCRQLEDEVVLYRFIQALPAEDWEELYQRGYLRGGIQNEVVLVLDTRILRSHNSNF